MTSSPNNWQPFFVFYLSPIALMGLFFFLNLFSALHSKLHAGWIWNIGAGVKLGWSGRFSDLESPLFSSAGLQISDLVKSPLATPPPLQLLRLSHHPRFCYGDFLTIETISAPFFLDIFTLSFKLHSVRLMGKDYFWIDHFNQFSIE